MLPNALTPYRINGLASSGKFQEAKDAITVCLQLIKRTTPKSLQYEPEQYESLVQLYIFHVLPALQQWKEAADFLEQDQQLPQWKRAVEFTTTCPVDIQLSCRLLYSTLMQ